MEHIKTSSRTLQAITRRRCHDDTRSIFRRRRKERASERESKWSEKISSSVLAAVKASQANLHWWWWRQVHEIIYYISFFAPNVAHSSVFISQILHFLTIMDIEALCWSGGEKREIDKLSCTYREYDVWRLLDMVWKSLGLFPALSLLFAYSTFFLIFFLFSLSLFFCLLSASPSVRRVRLRGENVAGEEWIHCSYTQDMCARTAQVIAFVTFNYMSSFGSSGFSVLSIVWQLQWMGTVCEVVHKLDYNVYIELTYGDSCKWHISDSCCFLLRVFFLCPLTAVASHLTCLSLPPPSWYISFNR